MAVNAAYQLSYTGEQVEDLLGQVTVNKNDIAQINTDLDGKVDKVAGKGLSENDFTTADKNKLSGIASGAEVNVNADWDAVSGDAQILNKPTIPSKTSQLTNDSGYITDAGVTSFNGQTGAVTYTPPAETDPVFKASPAYGISSSDISSWNAKQDTIDDLTVIRQGAAAGATAYQKPSGGIPKSDLSSSVQTSLDKADSAIQTETDPVFSASPAAGITSSDISSWNAKQSALTFDTTPTANSTNPVTSAGIKAYVDNATPTITMDDTPTSGSSNSVKSSGIYTALQGKQNTLTFDSTPTASSTNPVTSGGVKTALDLKANQSTTYTKTEVNALFDDVAYLGDDDGQATTLDFDPQADTVWNKAQTLSSAQKQQARENIGAAGINDIAGMQVVNHGTSDTTFALTPNKFHVWGEVASLTLTFATGEVGYIQEYIFQFTSGSTATTLNLPSSVKWITSNTVEANKTYQISILNSLAVMGGA